MASVHQRKTGSRYLKFTDPEGNPRSLGLGKLDKRSCDVVARHLEELVNASASGTAPGRLVSAWLKEVSDDLHDKLANLGLVEARQKRERPSLGAFLDGYIQERSDVKESTLVLYRQARVWLCRFLGEDIFLDEITSADADRYKSDMHRRGLALATIAKKIRFARHFFTVAIRRQLVTANPFGHLRGAIRGNPERRQYVDRATVDLVIGSIEDSQWRLLVALARYGGLRVPSEALALKWSDVDWEQSRFVVRSSKTEHHADGGRREVPIFPELRPHFEAAWNEAEPGAEHVIGRYKGRWSNLGTQLRRHIERAGVLPWPKLWQNLRASRATDLADKFPSHVCAAWLGHTERVANAHYRQVTDEHFARAANDGALPEARSLARSRQHSPASAKNRVESKNESFPGKIDDFAFAYVHDGSSQTLKKWAVQDLNL